MSYLKTWLSLASLTNRACRTFHCPPPSTHTCEMGETCGDGADPDCSIMTAVSTAVSAAIWTLTRSSVRVTSCQTRRKTFIGPPLIRKQQIVGRQRRHRRTVLTMVGIEPLAGNRDDDGCRRTTSAAAERRGGSGRRTELIHDAARTAG